MSFFSNLRADRLVTEITSTQNPADPATQKAVPKLNDLGAAAIEAVFGALPESDKNATVAFVEVLTGLVNPKTFPLYVRGLVEGSPRVISAISWALTSSRTFRPGMLLEAMNTPGISKSAILDVISAQKAR